MNPELGLQLWSVRESLQKDYAGTLEKVADIGYKNLELITTVTPEGLIFGDGMRAAELRTNLDRFGLRAVSCHFVPIPNMNLQAILDDLNVLGVDSLACAIAFFNNREEVVDFNAAFNRYAETCKRSGVQLYYHNHFHEFQVFGDKSIFDLMIEQMDKDLVMFELDTYWTVRGGQDPIYWLKKLGSRCDLIHQKDLPATAKPVNIFEKVGYDGDITLDTLIQSLGTGDPANMEFTEVGEGILNIPSYIAAGRKYNQARYIFIEQDMSSRAELDSVITSYANMSRLLA